MEDTSTPQVPGNDQYGQNPNPSPSNIGDNAGTQTFGNRTEMNALWQAIRDIEGQISQVIVGQKNMVELILVLVAAVVSQKPKSESYACLRSRCFGIKFCAQGDQRFRATADCVV